jgi:hypothetical protein
MGLSYFHKRLKHIVIYWLLFSLSCMNAEGFEWEQIVGLI